MRKDFDISLVNDPRSIAEFHAVPREIYKNDSNWIPHLKQDIEKLFDAKKNKLLKEGKAQRWILKSRQGELLGRIAAFIHPKTSFSFEQPTGGIGFFESIEDKGCAGLLLDTGREWLREQGMEAMDGPINFGDKNQFWGLLVKNFTDPISYAMNYNPAYYRTLFEDYGFETYYEQYLYSRDIQQAIEPVFVRKFQSVSKNYNIEVKDVTNMSLEQIAMDFRTVYNGAWGGHDNFKEMTIEAARKVAKSLKPIMDKRIIVFAYASGTPVGFYVNIPELNEIFIHVDGNLNWLGKLKFLYHKWKKTPKTMVGIVFGVVKEWQGKGIEGAMITWFGHYQVPKLQYEKTILTWIGDFNPKMIKVAENLGTEQYRTYITYRYLFDREKEFKRCPIIE